MQKQSNEIELFGNLSKSFEDEFYRYAKSVDLKKGTDVLHADELLKKFYIVIDGKIKTYQINFENDKEQTIFIYRRGDMFDVISLLDNQVHDVMYEILEDCKLLELPLERVRYWLENDPTFTKKFFPYLAAQMRHTEELSTDLALYNTQDRLIGLLVDNLNPQKPFKYQLLQNLSNSEIAKILGTVRHVIERALKQLKADNIIETGRKNIKIKSLQKLLDKTTQFLLK